MHLEHVGVAVRDAESTIALLNTLLGAHPYKSETVASEGVLTVFFEAGGPKLELLEARDSESPVARYIERRGEGLHHLAFLVDDIQVAFERLSDAGFRLLNDEPERGADDNLIFFIHPKDAGGVLVELCQTVPLPRKPRFAETGGRRIAYYEGGRRDASPLILLHGALGSANLELTTLMRQLEPRFRVIAVDFAGHGHSGAPSEGAASLESFALDVVRVLDHLRIDRAGVFGLSMGGAVALFAALNHGERLGGLVVHATGVQWDPDQAREMARSLEPEYIAAQNPEWAQQLAAAHGPEHWRHLAHQMARLTEDLPDTPLPDEDLARIEHRVMVSHGDSDSRIDLTRAIHLWRTLPNARLAVHPGLGHRIPPGDVRPFATTIANFLAAA